MSYNGVLKDAGAEAGRVAGFLEMPERAGAMAAAVDASLYRNLKSSER